MFFMSEWQPIGTAPQDGREIVVWIPATPEGAGFPLKARWTQERGWEGTVAHSLSGYQPSHWMPLVDDTDKLSQP